MGLLTVAMKLQICLKNSICHEKVSCKASGILVVNQIDGCSKLGECLLEYQDIMTSTNDPHLRLGRCEDSLMVMYLL